jgi:hypothetical protein
MNKKMYSWIMVYAVVALGISFSLFIIKVYAQQTQDIISAGGDRGITGEKTGILTVEPDAHEIDGAKIGSLTIEPNGHTIHITANVTSAPDEGKVYEGWLVDEDDSGYKFILGEFAKNGTLNYKETLVNPYTYTRFIVTEEPFEDKHPKAAVAFGETELQAPFKQ